MFKCSACNSAITSFKYLFDASIHCLKFLELGEAKKHLPITYFLFLSFNKTSFKYVTGRGLFSFSCQLCPATTSPNLKCITVLSAISLGNLSIFFSHSCKTMSFKISIDSLSGSFCFSLKNLAAIELGCSLINFLLSFFTNNPLTKSPNLYDDIGPIIYILSI